MYIASVLQREMSSQELLQAVLPKQESIPETQSHGTQETGYLNTRERGRSRSPDLRGSEDSERFLQEDENDKILDASEHIMKRSRQLVKRWVLNQWQLNRKPSQKKIGWQKRKGNQFITTQFNSKQFIH